MKKYILSQLTQVSTWIGIVVFLAAFCAPREYIAFLGIALVLTHDEWLKNWVNKEAPWLAAKIDEWTK